MKKILIIVIAIILIAAAVLGVSCFVGLANYNERSNSLADEANMTDVVNTIKLIVADKETNADICDEIFENAIINDSGMHEMTITFKPSNDGEAVYKFSDVVVNNDKSLKDCNALYAKLTSIFGYDSKILSKTHKNSNYTISIQIGTSDDGAVNFESINGRFSDKTD